MTVTTIYLQGSIEPFDETIRAFIARKWLEANTLGIQPVFVSPNGQGKDESNFDESMTKNDMESLKVDGMILFEAIEEQHIGGGRGKSGKTKATLINITIYGINRYHLFHFMQEFNRILSEFRPHTGLRIKKTNDSQDSAIAYFDRDQISWARPQKIEDSIHIVITTGQLGVRWLINET